MASQGAEPVAVDWRPPLEGYAELTHTRAGIDIEAANAEAFTLPPLNFRGTPVGIDVRKVMRTGITPWLNTGIAHREPGIGMVGAGLVQAPQRCFEVAFEALGLLQD
jgi:hypothetical protein